MKPCTIVQMIEWLQDCVWLDMSDDDFNDLSDAQITRGIERHFQGGVAGFLGALEAGDYCV